MSAFAITFAYNEAFFLPRWASYYGSQLGLQNLFVLDHGSSDLSTAGLGAINIIKVPRTPFDDVRKINFATYMHSALLQYYDAGFVVDADEFLVADPKRYRSLRDFAERTPIDAPAAVGLELCHIRHLEADFNTSLPILAQRDYVLFDSWMCKRCFARKSIRFGGGCHTSDQPVVFDPGLYLIHLKNFDYKHRLVRQQVTSAWNYSGDFGVHARRSGDYVDGVFDGFDDRLASGLVSREFDFSDEIARCLEKVVINPASEYDFNLNGGFQSDNLHMLPSCFHGLF
jgi:hypothetical protein